MKPTNWSRENLTDEGRASALSCKVWLDSGNKWYHTWESDIMAVNVSGRRLHVFTMQKGFENLLLMLDNFLNKEHRLYKPDFTRAEIYENFTGELIHWRDLTRSRFADSDSVLSAPLFKTDRNLKQQGSHRIIYGLESKQLGTQVFDTDTIRDVLNECWKFWMRYSRYRPQPKYNYNEVLKEKSREPAPVLNTEKKEIKKVPFTFKEADLDAMRSMSLQQLADLSKKLSLSNN